MGKLLRLIEREFGLQRHESELLTSCVRKRNWLAHSYWEQRSHLLATSSGCDQATSELSKFCDFFKHADQVVQEVSRRFRAQVGLSEEWAQNLLDEYVRRLAGGESSEEILRDQEERLRRAYFQPLASTDE